MDGYVSWLALAFAALVAYGAGLYLLRRSIWQGADCLLCGQCGYDMRGAIGPGSATATPTCPECGETVTHDTLERASARFARRPAAYAAVALVVVPSIVLGVCAWAGLMSFLP